MRRVVQRASYYSGNGEPSATYQIFNKILNNYKALRDNRRDKDYQYERIYKKHKNKGGDLTNIADYLTETGMPSDFATFFFHVENGELILRPVATQADINRRKLNVDAMEKYVWSLKQLDDMPNFTSRTIDGWNPNGKPPMFKKYKKRRN